MVPVYAYNGENTVSLDDMEKLSKNNKVVPFQYALIGLKLKNGDETLATCSGVALNPRTILTAAHCIYNYKTRLTLQLSDIRIYIPFTLSGDKPNKKGIKITYKNSDGDIFVSSDYRYGQTSVKYMGMDLAIIKLNSDLGEKKLIPLENTLLGLGIAVAGTTYPDPIVNGYVVSSLTTKGDLRYLMNPAVYMLGWGSNYNEGENIYKATSIACGVMNVGTINWQSLNNYNFLPLSKDSFSISSAIPNYLCSGNNQISPGSEQGDSGGPIFIQITKGGKARFELLGITSSGSERAGVIVSTMYADLLDNLNWTNALEPIAVVYK